eukprot:scaffold1740_cov254-Pinguiococcus_pyrenoidosus.AAC.24
MGRRSIGQKQKHKQKNKNTIEEEEEKEEGDKKRSGRNHLPELLGSPDLVLGALDMQVFAMFIRCRAAPTSTGDAFAHSSRYCMKSVCSISHRSAPPEAAGASCVRSQHSARRALSVSQNAARQSLLAMFADSVSMLSIFAARLGAFVQHGNDLLLLPRLLRAKVLLLASIPVPLKNVQRLAALQHLASSILARVAEGLDDEVNVVFRRHPLEVAADDLHRLEPCLEVLLLQLAEGNDGLPGGFASIGLRTLEDLESLHRLGVSLCKELKELALCLRHVLGPSLQGLVRPEQPDALLLNVFLGDLQRGLAREVEVAEPEHQGGVAFLSVLSRSHGRSGARGIRGIGRVRCLADRIQGFLLPFYLDVRVRRSELLPAGAKILDALLVLPFGPSKLTLLRRYLVVQLLEVHLGPKHLLRNDGSAGLERPPDRVVQLISMDAVGAPENTQKTKQSTGNRISPSLR